MTWEEATREVWGVPVGVDGSWRVLVVLRGVLGTADMLQYAKPQTQCADRKSKCETSDSDTSGTKLQSEGRRQKGSENDEHGQCQWRLARPSP